MRNLELLLPREHQQEDKFTWATVTANTPDVKVRLDGETDELDVACDSLVDVDWLDVGRRVWVQIHGRRLIVLGQALKSRSLALDTGWQSATLVNGWFNYAGDYGTIRYRRKNGVVYIEGLARNTTGNGNTIFTLPEGYRPGQQLMLASIQQNFNGANNGVARLNIFSNGVVSCGNMATTSVWVSVACSFIADG